MVPEDAEVDVKEVPFLYLTVDVPAAPLFKDALERNIIPQVNIYIRICVYMYICKLIDTRIRMEVPFLYLTVDVPAAPLFKDALERNIIPQVNI